ncbi:unnamed protein product [Pieris macdunnoughi]|uniref:Cuticle protein 16.5 n=1 Tax=Pieris macdunnoughi TaxID=345717 RepID=A0A821VI80_9NEOP|nr:unnamed protein product [Pieris macdunnoughi]
MANIVFLAALAFAAAKPSVPAFLAAAPAPLVAAPAPLVAAAPAPFVTASSSQYIARNYNGVYSAPLIAAPAYAPAYGPAYASAYAPSFAPAARIISPYSAPLTYAAPAPIVAFK